LGEVGRSWKKLEEVGRSWKKLEEVGRSWKKLEEVGRSWKKLEEVGSIVLKSYYRNRQNPDPEPAEGSFADKTHMAISPFGKLRDRIFDILIHGDIKSNTYK
jgi:hypothetical protein